MKENVINNQFNLKALAIPIFFELFLNMLLGNVDTLMLSKYSDDSVAAVGVANQVINLVIVMFGFVSTGTVVLISQSIGAKKLKSAGEIAAISIVTNFVFGIFLSMLLMIFGKSILQLMNISKDILEESYEFLRIVGGFMFFQSLILTMGAILRSHGYTKIMMNVSVGMNILNIIGNCFFIFGFLGAPILGVTGVAISTTVSRLIGLVVITILVKRNITEPIPIMNVFRLPKEHIKNLLKIGLPAAGEMLSYNLSQFVILYFITSLGTSAITTRIYTQNLMMFIYLASLSIAQGTQIIIGRMIGSGNFNEAYKRCMKSLKIGMLFSFLVAVLFSIFSKELLHIFTENKEIIRVGSMLLILTIILEPGRVFNLVIISSLRASGDVKFPLYMALTVMWGVGITLAYLLGIHFALGLVGVWISFIADEWTRGIAMLLRWRTKKWMSMAFIKND